MNIEEIREKWSLKEQNKKASVDMWNSMAGSFGENVHPGFEEDAFLKLLLNKNMLNPEGLILDVGCGAGKYALALAGRCNQVTGVDLSPQMIAIAEQKKEEYKIDNAAFYCEDWHDLDLMQAGWQHKFDLVFAHMTPAVQSADTLEKLSAASKGWCILSKPIRRTDPVSDAVKALAGIKDKRESSDEELVFAFELLWRQGYLPELQYEEQVWKMKKTLEQAKGMYINRIKTYRDISSAEEKEIETYLGSLAKDGFVYEEVDTTVATMVWQV
ncbi:MAG: Ubiquinone biosynthesis O-methyltransferase [Candidatus Dichloromethanomonas elyunquensis]|nr:MAG: Ubiquinone biosynthesis O-methyltransferase [Candidatus Dichloromethanomonas elyunquensis]